MRRSGGESIKRRDTTHKFQPEIYYWIINLTRKDLNVFNNKMMMIQSRCKFKLKRIKSALGRIIYSCLTYSTLIIGLILISNRNGKQFLRVIIIVFIVNCFNMWFLSRILCVSEKIVHFWPSHSTHMCTK